MSVKNSIQTAILFVLLGISASSSAFPRIDMQVVWREIVGTTSDPLIDPNAEPIFGDGLMFAHFSFSGVLLPSFVGQPTGGLEIDPTIIVLNGNPDIFNLVVSVTGSVESDGIWGISEFDRFIVSTYEPLDYTEELVGQHINAPHGPCEFVAPVDITGGDCQGTGQGGFFSFEPAIGSTFPGSPVLPTAYTFPPYPPDVAGSEVHPYYITSIKAAAVPVGSPIALLILGTCIMGARLRLLRE